MIPINEPYSDGEYRVNPSCGVLQCLVTRTMLLLNALSELSRAAAWPAWGCSAPRELRPSAPRCARSFWGRGWQMALVSPAAPHAKRCPGQGEQEDG